mmetsp:Transcript_5263/g.10905  ORF Transcript_5263/g.10905 Transcript_5263/m.10905 type:complete len:209 (-) Transcript_5263:287-913(-)
MFQWALTRPLRRGLWWSAVSATVVVVRQCLRLDLSFRRLRTTMMILLDQCLRMMMMTTTTVIGRLVSRSLIAPQGPCLKAAFRWEALSLMMMKTSSLRPEILMTSLTLPCPWSSLKRRLKVRVRVKAKAAARMKTMMRKVNLRVKPAGINVLQTCFVSARAFLKTRIQSHTKAWQKERTSAQWQVAFLRSCSSRHGTALISIKMTRTV